MTFSQICMMVLIALQAVRIGAALAHKHATGEKVGGMIYDPLTISVLAFSVYQHGG